MHNDHGMWNSVYCAGHAARIADNGSETLGRDRGNIRSKTVKVSGSPSQMRNTIERLQISWKRGNRRSFQETSSARDLYWLALRLASHNLRTRSTAAVTLSLSRAIVQDADMLSVWGR
jgi:hypothetical protein